MASAEEKLKMSLDEIINLQIDDNRNGARRGQHRSCSHSTRRGGLQRSQSVQVNKKTDRFRRTFESSLYPIRHTKLILSNLDKDVCDQDIIDLFSKFGKILKSAVHYNRFGKSLNTAEIIFEQKNSAVNAMREYNGVPLD